MLVLKPDTDTCGREVRPSGMLRSPDWYLVTDVSEQPVGPIFNRHAAPDRGGSLKSRSCHVWCRVRLKCDGTRAETRFRLSAKRSNPFKSAGGRQFNRLLAAEVCASAVVMLDTPCSEVV